MREDDRDLQQLYSIWLRLGGYDVCAVADGVEALRLVDAGVLPDVILLDLLLPTVDGVDVRRELATHAATRDIPIVVVTGSTRDRSDLDVAAVLRKPITPELLVATVRTVLYRPSSSAARPH